MYSTYDVDNILL